MYKQYARVVNKTQTTHVTKVKQGKVESNTVDVLESNNIAWYRSSAE